MIPVACVSGFLNNTPVVAVMIPIVLRWCESTGMAKEQLMIPLSFASVLADEHHYRDVDELSGAGDGADVVERARGERVGEYWIV